MAPQEMTLVLFTPSSTCDGIKSCEKVMDNISGLLLRGDLNEVSNQGFLLMDNSGFRRANARECRGVNLLFDQFFPENCA